MNYQNWYGNNGQYYMQNLQDMRDRIDNQMKQYQQNQMQMQQPQMPTNLTQNFQLAPQTNANELESKYVENIQDVKNTFVIKTGIFVNKDFSNLWVKDASGNIRTFKTEELIEMDERDKEIYMLRKQIEEMKGMIANEPDNSNVDEQIANTKSKGVSNGKRSNAK